MPIAIALFWVNNVGILQTALLDDKYQQVMLLIVKITLLLFKVNFDIGLSKSFLKARVTSFFTWQLANYIKFFKWFESGFVIHVDIFIYKMSDKFKQFL